MIKRTPLKRKPILNTGTGTLKRKSIKKRPPTEEKIEEQKLQRDKDWQFYQEIWDEREHRCTICSDKIYGELKSLYIDHIIEKSIRPELRYEKGNIAILCQHCHCKKTDGIIREKYRDIIEETKRKYNII